jgi:DtxR family Mn-dependent transcriptional regulator
MMVSQTKENYIKALFYLHQKNTEISLSDLGTELQVSKPTANDMIKKLKADGLVLSEKYKPIKITEKGKSRAAAIIRKHRLSEMFLVQIMGFGWEEVHEIAEELEHIKTTKFFDRMDELLAYPTNDPHGSPIPDKYGNFNQVNYKPLSQMSVGTQVVVQALRDSSEEFILFLNKKSIQLYTKLKIENIENFDGSFTVSYGKFEQVVLGKAICDRLLVGKV